jgi:hypothetical protein
MAAADTDAGAYRMKAIIVLDWNSAESRFPV